MTSDCTHFNRGSELAVNALIPGTNLHEYSANEYFRLTHTPIGSLAISAKVCQSQP